MSISFFRRIRPLVAVSLMGGLCWFSSSFAAAQAAPITSRSVRVAARLKKNPPNTWLKHYLPDDRYKIAGKVWKFVSTDLDTFYHRPDSPNMLRQPAGRVIGFSSAKEAEDAGYAPDPSDGTLAMVSRRVAAPRSSVVVVSPIETVPEAPITATTTTRVVTSRGLRSNRVVRRGGANRVLLADKVSSVALPKGWRHKGTNQRVVGQSTAYTDLFVSSRGEQVRIGKVQSQAMPAGFGFEQFLTPAFFNRLKKSSSRLKNIGNVTGTVNSDFSRFTNQSENIFAKMNAFRVRFGGLEGVGISFKNTRGLSRNLGAIPLRTYLVGRGSTLVAVEDFSRSGKAALPFLQSISIR